MQTDAMVAIKNYAEVTAWVLAALAACAAGLVWFTGRELDRRRTVEESRWRDRIASSETAAQVARKEAETLRQGLQPRDVSAVKREQMIAILGRSKAAVTVQYPSDPEAAVFAKRIGDVIREAGWTVTMEGVAAFGPIVGLQIQHARGVPPEAAGVLRQAVEGGLGVVLVRENPNLKGDDPIVLLVGSKTAE
jgi:hypothetical protein